jgi:DNA mismatch endonuclease, patch repair protein
MSVWPGNARLERTTFGRLTRAQLMSRVRSKGNKTTEERFAAMLRRGRISGWRRHRRLLGSPDFVWRKAKLAVFLDGCFWHGHKCRNTSPKTNAAAWRSKITKNRLRDRMVSRRLRADGWTVIRIWECQLRAAPDKVVTLVRSHVNKSA